MGQRQTLSAPTSSGRCRRRLLRRGVGHALDPLGGEHAALRRGEMGADQHLDRGDGGAEGWQVVLDKSRHDAHQHPPADLAAAGCRERRQRTKCRDLGIAMQSMPAMVEDQDDAPLFRKRQSRHDRRRPAAVVLAGVDDDATAFEAGDADAGSSAAIEQGRIAADIERQSVERAQRRGDGKGDLRAGAQTGMARDRLLDHQTVLTANAEMAAERRQMLAGALGSRRLRRWSRWPVTG